MYPGTKKKKKGRFENASVRAGNRELSGPERPRLMKRLDRKSLKSSVASSELVVIT